MTHNTPSWDEYKAMVAELEDHSPELFASLSKSIKWQEDSMRARKKNLSKPKKLSVSEEELPEWLARHQDNWCLQWDAIRDLEDEYPTSHKFWRSSLYGIGWTPEEIRDRHIYDAKLLQRHWDLEIGTRMTRYNRDQAARDVVKGIAPRAEHYEPERQERNKGTVSKRASLFGQPVTAVIRWMGDDGWSFDQAYAALAKLKIPVADTTIKAQLRAGQRGERGDPAKLSATQEHELYALI